MIKLTVGFDDLILKQLAERGSNPLFTLYWTQGQQAYPEKQWVDAGSVVLSWWLVSARALLEGAAEADFSFMEGAFSLTVRRLGNQVIITDAEQTWNAKLPLHRFISELLAATNQVLGKFSEIGINDQNGLEMGMRQLKIALSKVNNASSTHRVAASLSH